MEIVAKKANGTALVSDNDLVMEVGGYRPLTFTRALYAEMLNQRYSGSISVDAMIEGFLFSVTNFKISK